MKVLQVRLRLFSACTVCVLIGLVGSALLVRAETGNPPRTTAYDLSWSSVDGGGQMHSTGGVYELGGTVGQPDAGVMSGGGYAVEGGFWGGGGRVHAVFLPLVMRAP